jgi:hypothetical protein
MSCGASPDPAPTPSVNGIIDSAVCSGEYPIPVCTWKAGGLITKRVPSTRARHSIKRMLAMNPPDTRAADRSKPLTAEVLAARVQQLGTALRQLAIELVREHRRQWLGVTKCWAPWLRPS